MSSILTKIFNECGADAVLTSAEDLRLYLTGFHSTFGYVLTDKSGTVFYTDMRYFEAAEEKLKGTEIKVLPYKSITVYDIIKPYKKIALALDKITANEYIQFKQKGFEVCDSTPAFNSAMLVKTAAEIENIRTACKITDKAFTQLLSTIKEGQTESEVAAQLEYLMRKFGASGTSFDTIVAFGKNSSVPHHETGNTKLKFGDVILIDFGCKANGYCSDCTRTFLFGDDGKKEEFKKKYQIVLEAQKLVKEKVKEGFTGSRADAVAREHLKKYGLDGNFTHSLGHGIGINIHEAPLVSPKSEDILKNGMVFSDEPGVYFKGDFGIRIEDTICLNNGKIESLTNTDINLTIL